MLESVKQDRFEYLRDFFGKVNFHDRFEHLLPSEVERDYTPSGKYGAVAIPIMFLTGLFGIVVGFGASWLVSWLSLGVFSVFRDAGICLNIFFIPAALFYMLAPLIIAFFAGLGVVIGSAARRGHCRSPKLSSIMGFVLGIITSALVLYVTNNLYDGVDEILAVVDRLEISFTSGLTALGLGLFFGLTTIAGNYVWLVIVAMVSLSITWTLGATGGDDPYCEITESFLKKHQIKRVGAPDIQNLLMGLHTRNYRSLERLNDALLKDKEVLDVVLWTTDTHESNLLEVTAYYRQRKARSRESYEDERTRLIYSEWISKQDMEKILEPFNLQISETKQKNA